MNIILQTERLYLRQFTEGDATLIRELNSQPGVMQYLPQQSLASDEEAKELIINIILPQYKNNLGRWAVHLKVTDEFIGWCGLKMRKLAYRQVGDEIDIGYRFMPAAWGKGYATEAAAASLAYGHTDLQLEKIIAHAHIDNMASQKVLEKIGMQFAGEGMNEGLPVKGYVSFRNNL